MEAQIVAEDEDGTEVKVTDSNGVEHFISVGLDGEIRDHSQNHYTQDRTKRTYVEEERIYQADRYARYYLRESKGYDAVPWDLDPDRFETVAEVIAGLDDEDLDHYFGEYYDQHAHHFADDVSPPVSVSEAAYPDDYVEYRQDIYLDDEGDGIEATSGIHVMYYEGYDDERIIWGHQPFPGRDPDARLQHVPAQTDWEEFQGLLVHHLQCQIRDCYVGMGLEPPEKYRLLGPGISMYVGKYQNCDLYEEYHRYSASIPGFRDEHWSDH